MISSIIKWNKCKIAMKLISKKSLKSCSSPLIDWEITVNSGVEPSIDCAYKEDRQKIKNKNWTKTTRL